MGNRQRGNWRTFWSIANAALWAIPGFGAGATWVTRIASLAAAGVGQYIINSILPMLPGKAVDSPAYSWKHEPNLPANADIPMPIVYGKTRVKPVIKSRHVRLDGTKQYLDVMYSFTGHRVDERTITPWVIRLPGNPWQVNDEVTLAGFPGKTYICVKSHSSASDPVALGTAFWKLGHGTAYNAGISDITIDNNPIESYVTATPDIFTFETRAGAAQQTFIAGFETSYDNYPQGTVININQPRINPNQAIILRHQSTLVYYWNRHTVLYLGASYDIEESKGKSGIGSYPMYVRWSLDEPTKYTFSDVLPTTGSGYHLIATFNKSSDRQPTIASRIINWTSPNVVLSNIHDIELIFDFSQGLFSMDWENGKTITSSAVIYAQYREIGTTQWLDFKKIPKWQDGAIHVDYASNMHITANTTNNFSVSWSATDKDNYLDTTKNYEVQVYADCPSPVELANLAGVTYSIADDDGNYRPHTYPGECLLGIRALATGYLQGGFEVTAVIERSKVKVRDDTGAWTDKTANCHAWAVYDMLVNGWASHPEYPNMINLASVIQPVYGCGIDPDRINYDSFLDWEEHTFTTLEFRLNTVFDTTMTIWDAIGRICEEGMASLIPIGSEFRALVDRKAEDSEIKSLFCMGNINEGTFQQSWVDRSKKARSIEVHFADADRTPAYDETTFTVRIPEWDTADEQDSPLSMTLYGTTDYVQALAIAQYRLNCNYLLSQMIVFETDVEAMELEVGDVIPIQHDTIGGNGGRMSALGGLFSIVLDRSVTVVAGKSYEVYISYANGNMVKRTVTNTPGDYTTLTLTPVLSQVPAKYDLWAFGETGVDIKNFRIMSLTMNSEFKFEITAMEYDEDVYRINAADSTSEIGTVAAYKRIAPNLSLPVSIVFNRATSVTLQEVVSLNRTTGQYESSIVVKFTVPQGETNGEYEVSWRDVDADQGQVEGVWDSSDSYDVNMIVEKDGVVYISDKSGNVSEPFLIV